jgi:hypothetical protein
MEAWKVNSLTSRLNDPAACDSHLSKIGKVWMVKEEPHLPLSPLLLLSLSLLPGHCRFWPIRPWQSDHYFNSSSSLPTSSSLLKHPHPSHLIPSHPSHSQYTPQRFTNNIFPILPPHQPPLTHFRGTVSALNMHSLSTIVAAAAIIMHREFHRFPSSPDCTS